MKKTIREKLAARSGETLVETLVSVLVIALASLLLASMISASGSIDISARNEDRDFYEGLSKAEIKDGTDAGTGKITITVQNKGADGSYTDSETTSEIDVKSYGSDALASYEKAGG